MVCVLLKKVVEILLWAVILPYWKKAWVFS